MSLACAVTGASGFIGSVIVKVLAGKSADVTALTRHSPSQSCPWRLARKFDAVIHAGAYLPRSYADPSEAAKCLTDNSVATLQLLAAAEQAEVDTFVYLSSGQIYQSGSNALPVPEDFPTFPSVRAPYYLASKLVGDVFADHYRQTGKMRVVTLRPSSVYGPGMVPRGLVPRLADKLRNGGRFVAQDLGNYLVDLVHVDDVAWMAAEAATNPQVHGIYNVGGGDARSTIAIAQLLAAILNKTYDFTDLCNEVRPDMSHQPLDIARAKAIGYRPVSLVAGLESYLQSLGGVR